MRDILDVRRHTWHRIDGYKVDVLSVSCPKCGAQATWRCVSGAGNEQPTPHSIRYGLARRAAGVETPHVFRDSRSQCWPHNL